MDPDCLNFLPHRAMRLDLQIEDLWEKRSSVIRKKIVPFLNGYVRIDSQQCRIHDTEGWWTWVHSFLFLGLETLKRITHIHIFESKVRLILMNQKNYLKIKLDRNNNISGRVDHNSAFLGKRGNLLELISTPLSFYSDIKKLLRLSKNPKSLSFMLATYLYYLVRNCINRHFWIFSTISLFTLNPNHPQKFKIAKSYPAERQRLSDAIR
jgi:hypothetical protein